jgi:uncharacterized protein (TIGR02268 family)
VFQSVPLVLTLVLLGGAVARAQTAPARESHRRSVTLTGSPLEARIATGIRTLLVFGVPIRAEAVEVDSAQIQIVDSGKRSIIIEPLSEPLPGEHWTVRVPLADGKAPRLVEFALVAHPSEVDAELDVARAEEPNTVCQAECAPCSAMPAADAIISGLINRKGVQTQEFNGPWSTASVFGSIVGVSYCAADWVLVDVEIRLPPRHAAWRPSGATMTSKTGEVRVRGVRVEPSKADAEEVRVLAEMDAPPPGAGLEFTLDLNGPEGEPAFAIPHVMLPPAKEPKP